MIRAVIALLLAWLGAGALAQTAAPAIDVSRSLTGYPALLPVPANPGGPLPQADAATRTHSEASFAAAITYADKTDSDALLVWRAGKVVLAKNFPPYTATSRTWSASMLKTVVALTLGVAIKDGLVRSVDQPVSDYLTEWRGDTRRSITFRNLLEMSSGLEHPVFGSVTARALLMSDDVIEAGLTLQLVDRPGVTFDYNTTNVTLLMEAIHRAVGRPFATYLSDKLWRPLGAGEAVMSGDKSGHTTPSVLASADDWLRIGVLIAQRGRWHARQLVPAPWISRMETPSPTNVNYGWLTWLGSPPGTARSYGPKTAFSALHSEPFIAPDMVYLDGFGGQRVYITVSQKLVIVRTGAARADWDDAILPNAIGRAIAH